jgi:hypothetical protein
MFEYESLTRYPSAFRSLTGMSPVEFDSLLADFASAQQRLHDRSRTTRRGRPRQRAVGAGHPFAHDDRHRLLMALVVHSENACRVAERRWVATVTAHSGEQPHARPVTALSPEFPR